jgi:coenzyme F420-reducing hydrogenase gamma subunit
VIRVLVAKLTSCSGCLSEVIYALTHSDIRAKYNVTYFTEVLDVDKISNAELAFIEGSITTKHQEEFLKNVRSQVEFLIALGTCALMGGVQSLRLEGNIEDVKKTIYPEPRYIDVLSEVKPVDSVVKVDFAIPGCPINGDALVSFLRKYALGGLPVAIYETVCSECKRKNIPCIIVTQKSPCLGPITTSGCGALCPQFGRGCYGCYGLKFFDITREKINALLDRLVELKVDEGNLKAILLAYSFKLYSKLKESRC